MQHLFTLAQQQPPSSDEIAIAIAAFLLIIGITLLIMLCINILI